MRILCLFIAAAFITCNPKQEEPVIVNSSDADIAYTTCGNGDTTLLFVHGWCIKKEYWEPQLKQFCSQYKVVAVDLPGFGKSGKGRTNWNFHNYTEDIKATISQLQLKNVILIGHSMSGDMLLHFSNKYPNLICGIVGIDNLQEPAQDIPEDAKKQLNDFFSIMKLEFDSVVNADMKKYLFKPDTDSSIVNRVMNDVYSSDSVIAVAVLQSLYDVSSQQKKLMKGLKHRLNLISSSVNPVKQDSLLKYCAKGVFVQSVKASSHYPMIENPTEFNLMLQKAIFKLKLPE
ncbi:MAG: alpha/beta hydrolase [Ferruginibacter sp.]|nr:alpha/beta hydrolase [Ferruginibacter sp.]